MEKRKYFDYDLAYDMYEKCVKLFNKGGIVALEKEFDLNYLCEDNGYVIIQDGMAHNAEVYMIDRNFDKDTDIRDWYISGEVDLYSYGGGDDNIYINDNISITDRITGLIDYARKNDYSLDDIYAEYDSLTNVLNRISEEE